MTNTVQTPILEKPEDVAKSIWEAVKHQRSDVMVGTTNLWKAVYHLSPSLMQSVFRRVFGMEERS
jgi:short-subunit dehydrogenase